jgi:ornithine cyclodeaminase/alanine dehydrogenase-like protein (mu-crystallin family)
VEVRDVLYAEDEQGAIRKADIVSGVKIYKSVGVAAQDIAIAEEVVKRAKELQVGKQVDF